MNLKKSGKMFLSQFLNCYFFKSKVLNDNTENKNRVQVVVKLSVEIDPKILNQQ